MWMYLCVPFVVFICGIVPVEIFRTRPNKERIELTVVLLFCCFEDVLSILVGKDKQS